MQRRSRRYRHQCARVTIGPCHCPCSARLPHIAEELLRAINEPGESLAPAALAIARVEYPAPRRGALPAAARAHGRGGGGTTAAAGARRPADAQIADAERLPVRGARLQRQHAIATTTRATASSTKCSIGGSAFRSAWRSSTSRSDGAPACGSKASTFPATSWCARPTPAEDLIVDPFHAGALLSEVDCRHLLREHVGDETAFDRALLATATRQHIVVRMLVNLKRLYVRMQIVPAGARRRRSAARGRSVGARRSCAIAACSRITWKTSPSALRDLEAYLRLMPRADAPDPERARRRRRRRARRRSRRRSGSTSRRCDAASPDSINRESVWMSQSKRLNANSHSARIRDKSATP